MLDYGLVRKAFFKKINTIIIVGFIRILWNCSVANFSVLQEWRKGIDLVSTIIIGEKYYCLIIYNAIQYTNIIISSQIMELVASGYKPLLENRLLQDIENRLFKAL